MFVSVISYLLHGIGLALIDFPYLIATCLLRFFKLSWPHYVLLQQASLLIEQARRTNTDKEVAVASHGKRLPPGSSLHAPSAPAAPSAPGRPQAPFPPNDPLITIGGHKGAYSYVGGTTLAANTLRGGEYTVGGDILTRGGEVTYHRHTYSLASNGRTLVVDGTPSPITEGGQGHVPLFAVQSSGVASSYSSSGYAYISSSAYAYSSSSSYASATGGSSAMPSSTTGNMVQSSAAASSSSTAAGPAATGAAALTSSTAFSIANSYILGLAVLLLLVL